MGRFDLNSEMESCLLTGFLVRAFRVKENTEISLMSNTATMLLYFILMTCLFVLILKKKKRSGQSVRASLPGPVSLPLIGNLLQLGTNPIGPLMKLRRHYGDVFAVHIGQQPVVVLNGVKIIRDALVKKATDFASRPSFFTFKFFSEGKTMAFGQYGEDWNVHHTLAVKAMKMLFRDIPTSVESIVLREAARMRGMFLEKQQKVFTPLDDVFSAVGRVKYSLFYGKGEANDNDYPEMLSATQDLLQSQMSGNIINFIPWTRHILRKRHCDFLGNCDRMLNFTKRKEREHMDAFDEMQVKDALDALIKLSVEHANENPDSRISTDQILHTVQEFIGSGLDTVNATVSWALLYLAEYPEIQERIADEIANVIGQDRDPHNKDRSEMPYTEAFVVETLRYSSVVPFALPHCTTRGTQINGYQIEKDTTVLINLWSVNRDPETWQNPDTFDPSRFIDPETNTFDPIKGEKVMPFGTGKRRCLGEPLSRMEVFLFVASLLQKCKLLKPENSKYDLNAEFGLVLKPKSFSIRAVERR